LLHFLFYEGKIIKNGERIKTKGSSSEKGG